MDIDIVFNTIKAKLEVFGYTEIANDLEELVSQGSTGGEILALTAKYFTGLKGDDRVAYEKLKPEIIEYLKYWDYFTKCVNEKNQDSI